MCAVKGAVVRVSVEARRGKVAVCQGVKMLSPDIFVPGLYRSYVWCNGHTYDGVTVICMVTRISIITYQEATYSTRGMNLMCYYRTTQELHTGTSVVPGGFQKVCEDPGVWQKCVCYKYESLDPTTSGAPTVRDGQSILFT